MDGVSSIRGEMAPTDRTSRTYDMTFLSDGVFSTGTHGTFLDTTPTHRVYSLGDYPNLLSDDNQYIPFETTTATAEHPQMIHSHYHDNDHPVNSSNKKYQTKGFLPSWSTKKKTLAFVFCLIGLIVFIALVVVSTYIIESYNNTNDDQGLQKDGNNSPSLTPSPIAEGRWKNSTSSPPSPLPTPVQSSTLPYVLSEFEWKNPANWEYLEEKKIPSRTAKSHFQDRGILVDDQLYKGLIRTRKGWKGEKVIYVEWEASKNTDTNIWMLNKKINPQFGGDNGWPYYGELDIFEMFTNDKLNNPKGKYEGFKQFSKVDSYGSMTLHFGKSPKKPCECPSSHTTASWYQNKPFSTSACAGQFANMPGSLNSIATIFGSDEKGQYIEMIQNPVVKVEIIPSGKQYVNVVKGSKSNSMPRTYNTKDSFWGTPLSKCLDQGHNSKTGFPFFEDFRLIFQEQLAGGNFFIKNILVAVPR